MSKKRRFDPSKMMPNHKQAHITDIRPNEKNYNRQNKFVFQKMKESLEEFGFVDPVEVRSGDENGPFEDGKFEIIGGEHRWRAAAELGFDLIPINDLGNVPDVVAKKLMIVLNETKGSPDQDSLAKLISDIAEEVGLEGLSVLPYDDGELEALMELANMDIDDELEDELVDDYDTAAPDTSDKIRAADFMTLLGLTGLKQDEMQRAYREFEQWAFSRSEQDKPAYESLIELFKDQLDG